jgi:trehalose synthase
MHNALQGEHLDMELINKSFYIDNNNKFSRFTHIDHDCVIVHDPQPLPLIKFCEKKQPWIWRCHIDLSKPHAELWDYLKTFILRYDCVIVSDEKYKRKDLPVEQVIIYPSIDPLSLKNCELPQSTIDDHLAQYNIPRDKPLLTQISRFDKWKDPEGVIQVFKKVKSSVDCRLILCGSAASDDPEGFEIYRHIVQNYQDLIGRGDMLLINAKDNIMVNALQRASAVIMQKSTREGFGLTVAEAMWKGTPVIASNVGGIPNQIDHGKTGILVDPNNYDECAEQAIRILQDQKYAETLGKRARESVRKKFLITRHLMDYVNLLLRIFS